MRVLIFSVDETKETEETMEPMDALISGQPDLELGELVRSITLTKTIRSIPKRLWPIALLWHRIRKQDETSGLS